MAFVSGKDADFRIDNSGDSLIDISPYVTAVDFPQEAAVHEVTAFQAADRDYVVGLKSASLSIQGHWDGAASPAIDVILQGIVGLGTKTFNYGPAGTTGGNIKYSGECILTSYRVSGNVDGSVDCSADFQISGAVTRGTY